MRRSRIPSSKSTLSYRVVVFDIAMAVIAPVLALWIRDPEVLSAIGPVAVYVAVSACFSVWFFVVFRIAHGFPSFFSFHDAIQISNAALCTVTATAALAFTTTRLEQIPRSVPAIHFLVLVALLAGGRLARRLLVQRRDLRPAMDISHEKEQNILIVGAGRLAWFYVRFLDSFPVGNRRIAAILDDSKWMHGRSIYGHVIVGGTQEITPILNDFAQHGLEISTVVICERDRERALEYRDRLAPLCRSRGLQLELLGEKLGVLNSAAEVTPSGSTAALPSIAPNLHYFRVKRVFDAAMATLGLIACAPLFVLTGLAVLISMGSPVIFWQRRVGRDGRTIYVYKFKTMRNAVDSRGRSLSLRERSTHVGRALRATRLDELPQLFNVIKGDMALVGPRPLLPIDQPAEPSLRLAVAPGLTGWAQIHGGKLVSIDEKSALDEWYVRNACLRLDAEIVWRTFSIVLKGDRRDVDQLAAALDQAAKDRTQLGGSSPATARRRQDSSGSGDQRGRGGALQTGGSPPWRRAEQGASVTRDAS